MSFGSETNGVFDVLCTYVDQAVYNTGRTISVAGPNFCSSQMGSPEIAFNVLVVELLAITTRDDIAPCTGAVGFSAFMIPTPHNDGKNQTLSPLGIRS